MKLAKFFIFPACDGAWACVQNCVMKFDNIICAAGGSGGTSGGMGGDDGGSGGCTGRGKPSGTWQGP